MLRNKSIILFFVLLAGVLCSNAVWSATAIYRSVGPNRIGPLATGSGNLLTISGSNAGFMSDLPGDVGVGDVIVYDSNNDGLQDAVAFIHSRSAGSVFVVQDASGVTPVPTSFPDEDWAVYRAYTSLYAAEQGAENTGIPSLLRDFDNAADGWNLTGGDRILQLACYGDDVDTTPVVFEGTAWTTDAAHYVRIFTPVETTHVGASQRHDGKWNINAYRLVTTDVTCLEFRIDFFRVEGLQFNVSAISGNARKCLRIQNPGTGEMYVSHSVFAGTTTDQEMFGGLTLASAGSGLLFVWNNVFYDFQRSGTNWVAGLEIDDADFTVHVLNNTFAECYVGLYQNSGTVYAINNITQGCADGFVGSFMTGTGYNLSDLSVDAPGVNSLNNSSVAFASYAGRDFHLSPLDTAAMDNGSDLSSYPAMPFSDDIDQETRSISWDIGCDQEYPIPTATPTVSMTPTTTPTPTNSETPTVSPSPTLSPSPSLTITVSPSPTASPSPSLTITASPSPTVSPTGSATVTSVFTATNTPTVSPTPSDTLTPTGTPTETPTSTHSPVVTPTPTSSITVTPVATQTRTLEPTPAIESVRLRNNVIKAGGNQRMVMDIPLDYPQNVSVRIYNQRGKLMAVVCDEEQGPGIFEAVWQGRDETGAFVRSGVYLVTVKTDRIEFKKKVAVIR